MAMGTYRSHRRHRSDNSGRAHLAGYHGCGQPEPDSTSHDIPDCSTLYRGSGNREGLECILVLAALIAGLKGKNYGYQRPIQLGAGLGFLTAIITWFVAITIVSDLTANYGALAVQAATGMFAVIVLLIVMNWFFHGVYWSGWINMQNRAKRSLIARSRSIGQKLTSHSSRSSGTGLCFSIS